MSLSIEALSQREIMKTKSLGNTLNEDYEFIFEALKQLKEGTCCSHGNHEICTWNLLPRISEALQEHISFEEKWHFPELKEEERSAHQNAHKKLLKLLASASWELECGYGDQLKNLISELEVTLRDHYQFETKSFLKLLVNQENDWRSDDDYKKIRERLLAPWSA
jgi:hypothetical protein